MNAPTPVVVVAVLVLVIIAGTVLGGGGETVKLYEREADMQGKWHRDELPKDRWIGFIVDKEGYERLSAGSVIPVERLPERALLTEETLLVAYLGAVPTGGYGVRVTEISYVSEPKGKARRVMVRLVVRSPGPGDFVTQAFTYPVDMVSVPKASWPATALTGLVSGEVVVEAVDQDGRNWGPVEVYHGP